MAEESLHLVAGRGMSGLRSCIISVGGIEAIIVISKLDGWMIAGGKDGCLA